jgi:hypothetical protein
MEINDKKLCFKTLDKSYPKIIYYQSFIQPPTQTDALSGVLEALVLLVSQVEPVLLADGHRVSLIGSLAVLPAAHETICQDAHHGDDIADDHGSDAANVSRCLLGSERLGADNLETVSTSIM